MKDQVYGQTVLNAVVKDDTFSYVREVEKIKTQHTHNVSGKNSQLGSNSNSREYILVTFQKKKCTSLDEHIRNGPFETAIFFSVNLSTSLHLTFHPPRVATYRFSTLFAEIPFAFQLMEFFTRIAKWKLVPSARNHNKLSA